MRAKKKPIVVSVYKWKGMPLNKGWPEWLVEASEKSVYEEGAFYSDEYGWYINTLEGKHNVSAGDYIIQGVSGELYPVKPDIFKQTYDIVST